MDKFDTNVTNFFKGIACCLILSHHLFFNNPNFGMVLTKIGVYSKVCVAMFCLLSGYGLAVSSRSKSLKEFYVVRFSKLYLGFWSIAAVFIPVSWLVFNLGVHQVFAGDHVWLKFISQLLGLQQYYGGTGFSGPWGFMSIILTLYLFFPLLDFGCRRHPALTFIFCIAFLFAGFIIQKGYDVALGRILKRYGTQKTH